jgi:small subunit ribosomal protein S2
VIGLVDTNADPDEANYVIPGNDDAIRSCNLIARVIADGIAAGKMKVTASELTAEETPSAEEPTEAAATTEPDAEPGIEPDAEPELEPAAAVADGSESE